MVLPGWVVLNFFCMLLLGLLLYFQSSTSSIQTGRKYSSILLMTLLLLASETIGRFGETHPDNFLFLAHIGYFIIFLFDPVNILFALSYVDCWMDEDKKKRRTIFRNIFKICSLINILFVTFSSACDLKLFFYFEDGVYYRGPFFYARAAVIMVLIILLLVYVVIYRDDILEEYRQFLILLPLLALIGAILQVFLADMDTTYAGIAIGCLVLFFFLQSRDVNVDYLTGVLNRRGLDLKMEDRIKQSNTYGNRFCAIMMDVDHFKEINDHYGHSAGDQTVKDVADILSDVFGHDSSIGRFGGDEFCVISEETDPKEVDDQIKSVHRRMKHLREKNGWSEMIDVSSGYRIYDPGDGLSIKEFQEKIDALMYEEKKEHHLNDRRKGREEV